MEPSMSQMLFFCNDAIEEPFEFSKESFKQRIQQDFHSDAIEEPFLVPLRTV